jgi:ABC-type nitrate/sulfonate/bicarbonate transport system substrate-binding protein
LQKDEKMRKECRSLLNVIAGLMASITALVVHPAHGAEPIKIRVGWVVAPANLVPVLFAKPGLAKHLGKSYVFEPIYFGASPKEITALATDELDIGALGFSSLPLRYRMLVCRICGSSPMKFVTAREITSPPNTSCGGIPR